MGNKSDGKSTKRNRQRKRKATQEFEGTQKRSDENAGDFRSTKKINKVVPWTADGRKKLVKVPGGREKVYPPPFLKRVEKEKKEPVCIFRKTNYFEK